MTYSTLKTFVEFERQHGIDSRELVDLFEHDPDVLGQRATGKLLAVPYDQIALAAQERLLGEGEYELGHYFSDYTVAQFLRTDPGEAGSLRSHAPQMVSKLMAPHLDDALEQEKRDQGDWRFVFAPGSSECYEITYEGDLYIIFEL